MAVVVSLVAVPVAWGDPGGEPGPPAAVSGDSPAASAEAHGGPGGETTDATTGDSHAAPEESRAASEDPPGSPDTPGHDESAVSHGAADDAGDHGNSAAAEHGNADAAEHGNADDAPGHEVDREATVAQSAAASSAADQNRADNGHHAVRIDEPGNGRPVDQRNEAAADAAASVSAVVDDPDAASIEQTAHAGADAAQSDVANTAVTVRVGSGGDDGAVSQTNAATGSASATTTSGGASPGVAEAQADATQDDVANTAVSVRVFSPGDDGPVTQRNDATAHARANEGDGDGEERATARQSDVSNTNVSVRVESPGEAGQVVQQSATSAEGTTAVAVTTDAVDTNIAVAVTGSDLDRPDAGGLQIWEWDWTWLRDESESPSDSIAADVASWNWSWDQTGSGLGDGHGTVTSRTATAGDSGLQGGSWSWTWDWERSGVASWDWEWSWQATLSCSTCIWIWNWSWSWVGTPTESSTPSSSSLTPANGTLGQSNVVVANANASATALVDQDASQAGSGPGTQFTGQLIDVTQDAEAVADARQSNVRSVVAGDEQAAQENVVISDAATVLDATVAQRSDQLLASGEDGAADQWSGQEAVIVQTGASRAAAAQHDVLLTGAGSHEALAHSSATGTGSVVQLVAQDAQADAGAIDQWAGQLALVEQAVDASSAVEQAGTPRSRRSGGTASASSTAGGLAMVDQAADQAAVRGAGLGVQTALQLVYVAQDASAHATTAQQAGSSALPLASSEATAVDRAAVVQEASQAAVGSSPFDSQDLLQQSIVVQTAVAVSTSNGGIAGTAVVVNCAVVQQGTTQSLGAGSASTGGADLSPFCAPPASQSTSPSPYATPTSGAASPTVGEPLALAAAPVVDDEPVIFHGGRGVAASSTRAAHRAPAGTAPIATTSGRSEPGQRAVTHLSALPSTQARLDTRPGSDAGAGDAGKEPPLPPAGDPPMWVSALAASVTGAGPSGIAAISEASVLVPPLVRRAREGSVVRRPATVFARVEVPV